MVSYMYQYENGVKRKNVGYARVEAKNGQCKITLHMQLLGQLDSIFPTYLIQRDGNNLDLIYLGDTVLKNQVMDSKLIANEANIMDSGHSLSEMGGMLLFLNDNVFFATEWDDKPIIAKEVLEALKPKKQKEFDTRSDVLEDRPYESYYGKYDVVEQAQVAEGLSLEAPEAGISGSTVELSRMEELFSPKEVSANQEEINIPQEALSVANQEENKSLQEVASLTDQEGSNSGILNEAKAYTENTTYDQELYNSSEGVDDAEKEDAYLRSADTEEVMSDYYSAQKLSLEEELKLPKYKLPRGWKTIERLYKSPEYEVNIAEQVLEAEDLESPEARQANTEIYDQDQHLAMQQNLFGELLEQFQESEAFQEESDQNQDEIIEGLYGDEQSNSYDRMNEDLMREYFGEDNFYEDEPNTSEPLVDNNQDSYGEPQEEISEEDNIMPELPEESVMPSVPSESEMPEGPEFPSELDTPEIPEGFLMPEEPMAAPIEEPGQEPGEAGEALPDEEGREGEPEAMPMPEREAEAEEPEHPTAKNFFDNYPRIYPFEDNEIIFCVKIEPKDIGMLPKELWPLSNNSFLMHGFYCYHHLIFAKLKNRYGTYYILGIPGIYHSREKFMAKMFGFDNFKSIRKRDLRQGDFGYWYLPVKF